MSRRRDGRVETNSYEYGSSSSSSSSDGSSSEDPVIDSNVNENIDDDVDEDELFNTMPGGERLNSDDDDVDDAIQEAELYDEYMAARERLRVDRHKRGRNEYADDDVMAYDDDAVGLRDHRAEDFFPNPADMNEDAEDEEREAGMVLPRVVLTMEKVYYRELFRVICAMGTATTEILTQLLVHKKPITPPQRRKCEVWLKYWTSYLVENHYSLLGAVKSLPTGVEGATEPISGTMCLMGERWRIQLILNHHRLKQLRNWKISDSNHLVTWLLETPGTRLDTAPEPPDPDDETPEKWEAYEKLKAAYQPIADMPILMMRQSHIRRLIQHITCRMETIPWHDDLKQLFDLVEIKNAMFFCRSMPSRLLDDKKFRSNLDKEMDQIAESRQNDLEQQAMNWDEEEADAMREAVQAQTKVSSGTNTDRYVVNRDYWLYCTCYFYPLVRTVYFLDMFPRLELDRMDDLESYVPEGALKRMEEWVRKLAKSQGDKFSDRLEEIADDAMTFPGDAEWQSYRFPQDSTHAAVVLRKVRGEEAYKDYYFQVEGSQELILSEVNRNWTSTNYVIAIFDRYMKAYKGVEWEAGYVIRQEFIDDPETLDKWSQTSEPMLITIAGGFWLMLKRRILPLDNVYLALCMWLLAIRRTRIEAGAEPDCVFGNTYIGDLIDTIVLGKVQQQPTTIQEQTTEYREKLKRGLPVHTTQYHI